jgi:hypothetical protein
MLEWNRYGFDKNHVTTHYAECVFLHPVESAGHVVHSIVCGARNIDALILMPGWDRYGFHKKRDGTCYAKLVFLQAMGSAGHVVHSGMYGSMYNFSCSGGTGLDLTKSMRDMLRRTCVFASDRIWGSCSAFQCIWGMKHRHTIFRTWVGPVRIP